MSVFFLIIAAILALARAAWGIPCQPPPQPPPPDARPPPPVTPGGAAGLPPGEGADKCPRAKLLMPPGTLTPPVDPKAMEHHLDWLVVPLVSYDSDYKLSYGAAGQFQWAGEVDPYRYQLRFQVLFTTSGRQSHWVQYDAPKFLGTKLRVWANAGYSRDMYSPYYGLGNASSSSLSDHPELTSSHPFAFDSVMPYARLGASYPVLPHVHAFFFTTFLNEQVHGPAGTLLGEQRPYGFGGGHELQGMIGIYRNTRDHEVIPSCGSLMELSLRGAAQALGSSYTYGGINARVLKFVPLLSRLVLATRFEGDLLSHGTPFYELNQFGGVDAIDGVGGEWSVRGIPVDRYIGRGKVIGTVELRLAIAHPMVFGEPLSIGTVAFTDLGRVWQFDGKDGPWYGVHAGYGGGIRLWRRSFVLRLDAASSLDRPFSLYVLFGQFF